MFHDFGWGWMFMGPVFWLIIIGLVIFGLTSRSRKGTNYQEYQETPLDILKKRYAKGEINRDQYEQMKKDLGY